MEKIYNIKQISLAACQAVFSKYNYNGIIRICTLTYAPWVKDNRKTAIDILNCSVSELPTMIALFWDYVDLEHHQERTDFLEQNPIFYNKIKYFLNKNIPLNRYMDFYISANGFKRNTMSKNNPNSGWNTDNIFSFHNIVIDIDHHNSNISAKTTENLSNKICETLFMHGVEPSVINFTGRGFQMWFSITPCYNSLDKPYNIAKDSLCSIIGSCIQEYPEYGFSIDHAASKPAGIFRLFGSYNSKAKVFSKATVYNSSQGYNINTLCSFLGWHETLKTQKATRKQLLSVEGINQTLGTDFCPTNSESASSFIFQHRKEEPPKKKSYKFKPKKFLPPEGIDYTPMCLYRMNLIEFDIVHKKAPKGNEYRQNHLYAFYNYARQIMNTEYAEIELRRINRLFKIPLPENELKAVIHQIDRKNHPYKWKKDHFLTFLNISKESEDYFRAMRGSVSHGKSRRSIEKSQKYYIKKQKIKKVNFLFEKGKSISRIALEMNLSRPTVRKYLKKNSVRNIVMTDFLLFRKIIAHLLCGKKDLLSYQKEHILNSKNFTPLQISEKAVIMHIRNLFKEAAASSIALWGKMVLPIILYYRLPARTLLPIPPPKNL